MSRSSNSSRASEVPSEVWHEMLLLCSIEEILILEQTCHSFHELISSRHLWLRRLQDLDQVHAPDLPPHIPVSSLTCLELRKLVIRARRRVLNCTGPSPLRVTREVIIPIGRTNIDGILGEPFGWGADTLLLPGGQYFIMKWPSGYLQFWDVAARECVWTFPDLQDTSDTHEVSARGCFTCDVQTNGDVHVAVVSEIPGNDARRLEILSYSPSAKSPTMLFQSEPVELDVLHGLPALANLCGDIVIVYTEGYLIVTFWKENRSVVVTEGIIDALEIVDGYIICVSSSYEGNSLVAIPLSSIRDATTTHIKLSDLPIATRRITPPAQWLIGRAQLSICKFHWQDKSKRQDIVVTVLGDVYNEQNCCDFPVADFFSFGFDDSDLSQALNARPTFTPLGRSRFMDFDAQFSTYSVMTPPSQAGSTVLAFHDDRNHETRFARTFATFVPGEEVAVRVLDDAVIGDKPATYSLNVEFYSGAIHYVTRDLKNIVIRYLD